MSPSGAGASLTVLLFHKVPVQADALTPNELCFADFENMLDFLQGNMRVLPLADAIQAASQRKLPRRSVAITFDDGYAEWRQNVAPALAKRGLPATFFVTTELFDGVPLWHERIVAAVRTLPAVGMQLPTGFGSVADLSAPQARMTLVRDLQERLKYLPLSERLATIDMLEAQACTPLLLPDKFDADDVRHLHGQGFEIGAHTIRHPILNECTDAEAIAEMSGCKASLEEAIGAKVRFFAYPNGRPGLDYQPKHVAMVKASGYVGALASCGGVFSTESDIFQIPRTTIWGNSHVRMAYHLGRNIFSHQKLVHTNEASADATQNVRCLLLASTFPPIHGGSAVVYHNLCLHMPPGSIRVLTANENYLTHKPIDGWQAHDQSVPYPVDRLPLLRPQMLPAPANILVSVLRLVLNDMPLYARSLWTAARIVRKHQINLVCVGELVTGSWLGFALKRLFGCKVVIYVHGEEVTTATGGRLHGNRRGDYLRRADKVVAVSSFTCDALTRDMGVQPTRLALIQNGVDTYRFTPGVPDAAFLAKHDLIGKKIVVTVGRLVPRKGIDMAIRAMRLVVNELPEVRHIIVGDGDYQPVLKDIIDEENLAIHVNLVGKTSDHDLLQYLRCCDVFLMPNRTMPDGDTEGFGLVFREANACAKPVIGGRAGGAVEAVADGKSGFLVDGQDISDIASALLQLLKTPELAKHMGQQGLQLALANNTKAVSERFLKMCDGLLHSSSR